MKLDSKIISALIIGVSILISTIYYAKNTDYQSCVKARYNWSMENTDPDRAKYQAQSAHNTCSKWLFTR